MVNDLRGDLYAHLQRLSLGYHSRQRVGDLMYRITADSFAVQTMIMNGLLPILSALVLLGGMLIVLFPIDPLLTVLALTIVPVLFALIAAFNRRIVDVATEVRDLESRVYSLVQWGMSAIKVVQAFTKEEEEHRRFMGASRESLRATLRLYNWQTLVFGGGQCRRRGRHRDRRLCRRAGGAVRQSDRRAAARLYLLSGAALPADQPDHAELGPDRGGAGRRDAGLRGARNRGRPAERDAAIPAGRRAGQHRLARCQLPLSARDAGAERHRCHGRRRVENRDRRPDRRRQIDAARLAAAILRSDERNRRRSTASISANTR